MAQRLRGSVALALLVAAALAAPGCGGDPLAPREVPIDRVNCARCGMLVSDLHHAAQGVAAGDEPRFYDDIGCLRADPAARREDARAWVRDGDAWLEARRAWYARPAEARTPMGSGLRAYRTEQEARGADRDGKAMSWEGIEEGSP